MKFQPLTMEDIPVIRPYFSYSATRACDNTIGGTVMWRDYFKTEFSVWDDTLIFKVRYFGERTAFSVPLGKNPLGALSELKKECAKAGIPFLLCTATEKDIELLNGNCTYRSTEETDWADYVYDAAKFAMLPGRKYSGQRNHINRFKKEHPYYRFREITAENLPAVRSFFDSFAKTKKKDSPFYYEEERKVFEVLDNYALYGQTGLVLYAGEQIVAFCIGEIVGDTLFVHIEKARAEVTGAYQMISSQFAKEHLSDGILYVNREEDVGDIGLRTSKLSYHPAFLLKKYTVEIA